MTASEILARRRAQFADHAALDAAALAMIATKRRIVRAEFLSQLAGAPQSANAVGGFYQPALNQEWGPNGSPMARNAEDQAKSGIGPQFAQQNAALQSRLKALGMTNAGGTGSNLAPLNTAQSDILGGATAPFYAQALGDYGGTATAAGGAQTGAYTGALSNFYNLVGGIGSAAAGAGGGGGGAPEYNDPNAYNADGSYTGVSDPQYGPLPAYNPGEASNANPYAGITGGG